ncbi:MAG TPA: dTMP kinase, partial [Bacillota bacterium]|nr:dTMP kinase [Bacillota bacterium]
YQGYARGLGVEEVLAINEFAVQNCWPQLTLYLKIAPKKGIQRIIANKDRETNRLDAEDLSFHQKVYEGYEYLLKKYPERIQMITADQSFEYVYDQSLEVITSFFKKY